MPNYRKPYVLHKRPLARGHVWYYKLPGEKTAHSTGKSSKREAIDFVETQVLPRTTGQLTLGEYLAPYFVWDKCPHARRLRTEGKSISPRYAGDQRSRIVRFVLPDPICDIPLASLKRADILDFRDRLILVELDGQRIGMRTANCTIGALKTALREAYFREEIDRDPTVGIGEIKYKETEVGVFSLQEVKALFKEVPGVWQDLPCYVAFIIAAQVGLRSGEVRALIWGQIDFDCSFLDVDRAMTDNGLPKWDKIRGSPIPALARSALLALRKQSEWVLPHQYVICSKKGRPRSEHWWRSRFWKAMDLAGIDRVGRHLVPHSFRHALNSALRGAGVDATKIRQSLGWSSERTQDRYTHWRPEHFEDQRRKIDDLFE